MRLAEKAVHLVAGEHVGKLAAAPGRAQGGRGVGVAHALAPQMAVERAQAGGLAVDRGGGGWRLAIALRETGEEVRDVGARGARRRLSTSVEEAPELEQVRSVGLQRIARQPALELEVGEEVEHQMLERLVLRGSRGDGHETAFVRRRGIP